MLGTAPRVRDFRRLRQNWEQDVTKRELDQKAAIMLVIEHFGNVAPGTKCSAVFFDKERIRIGWSR